MNTIRETNSLDPDQACLFVGPGLGPNSLQRLSADCKSPRKLGNSCYSISSHFLCMILFINIRNSWAAWNTVMNLINWLLKKSADLVLH